MDKIIKFLKKNYLLSIVFASVLLVIIITLIVFAKRGTFGLNNNANKLTIECEINHVSSIPENNQSIGDLAGSNNEYLCSIKLFYDTDTYNGIDKKIYSVNANFNLPTGVSYVDFSTVCDDCDVAEHTENGFAIGKIEGLSNDSVVGMLKINLPEDITDATYDIGLTNIELSDSDYEMLELEDASYTIVIGGGGNDNPPEGVAFANDLDVNERYKIIYNIPMNTTYGNLLDKITTSAEIGLYNDLGNKVQGEGLNNYILGTNCYIEIKLSNNETYIYHIAVLNDYNGDGVLSIGDVSKLYNLKKSKNMEAVYRFAGNMSTDGEISIGAVASLYHYYKQQNNPGNGN